MTLLGRAAIVTGGASGLGRAIALHFARLGVNVCIMSLSRQRVRPVAAELKHFASLDEISQTKTEIEAAGVRCVALDGDISDPDDVRQMVAQTLTAFGRLDILVNNAATDVVHPVRDHPDEAFLRVIHVNLIGVFRCVREALPHLIAGGWGRIISIASTNAHLGTANYSAYCASKHGLLGFNRALALEVAAHNITANTISPGFVETPSALLHIERFAQQAGLSADEMRAQFLRAYPQNRFLDPDEIAALAAFLCTDAARGINGEDIKVTTGAPW